MAGNEHGEGKVNDVVGGGENSPQREGSGSVDAGGERFDLLEKIVRDYFVDGAPNEINIRFVRSCLRVPKRKRERIRTEV